MSKNSVAKVFEQYGDDIIQMRINNVKVKDIASKYNLNPHTVSSFLERNNIRIRGIQDEDTIHKIINMYNSGVPMYEIGHQLHFSGTTISEILKNHNVAIRPVTESNKRYEVNEQYFEDIDTQDKAYILGLFYADGCRHKNCNTVSINLQERDKDILEKIKECIEYTGPLRYIDCSNNGNRQNQWCLSVSNKNIADCLYEYGIVPAKEFKVQYPSFLTDELMPHFIRGYLDGDGCICKTEKRVSLTGTKMLLSGIKSYVENKLGIHFSLLHYNKKNPITCDIRVAGTIQCKKFLDYIYNDANLYLNRKHELYQNIYC